MVLRTRPGNRIVLCAEETGTRASQSGGFVGKNQSDSRRHFDESEGSVANSPTELLANHSSSSQVAFDKQRRNAVESAGQ